MVDVQYILATKICTLQFGKLIEYYSICYFMARILVPTDLWTRLERNHGYLIINPSHRWYNTGEVTFLHSLWDKVHGNFSDISLTVLHRNWEVKIMWSPMAPFCPLHCYLCFLCYSVFTSIPFGKISYPLYL